MTVYGRAAQLWSLLALAATNRQILTYRMLSRLTGVARVGLGQSLDPIQSYCLLHELPPLTILAVSEISGRPGVGFVGDHDFARSQQEVFRFNWMAHGGPAPESFEAAAKERPVTLSATTPGE